MLRLGRIAYPIAVGCAVSFAGTAAAEDAERGRELALRWCTSCHVVADDVPGGTLGPAFSGMMTLRGRSETQLQGWLAAPHEPMPNFGLSGREITDLVAYIATITKQPSGEPL